MKISKSTRQNIFDSINIENIYFAGDMNPVDFLNRIFTLKELPSSDSRFKDAEGDIWQHTINNDDWEMNWVFQDSRFNLLEIADVTFLRFLCEMLHPLVRRNVEEVEKLKMYINDNLHFDGYELITDSSIARRPVFIARQEPFFENPSLKTVKKEFDSKDDQYILKQITRMETSIDEDPYLAIGTAKELIETVCKTILEERGIEIEKGLDLSQLVKETTKSLKLSPHDIPDEAKASEVIRKILGNLAAITQGIAELRNQYGTGHGKSSKTKGLQPRHARLAVEAASTLVIFLFETHKIRK